MGLDPGADVSPWAEPTVYHLVLTLCGCERRANYSLTIHFLWLAGFDSLDFRFSVASLWRSEQGADFSIHARLNGNRSEIKTTDTDTDFSLAVTDWRSRLPQGFLQATAQGAENLPQRAEGLAQEVLQGFQKKGLSQNHGDIRRWKEKKSFLMWHFVRSRKVNSHVVFISTTYQAFFLFFFLFVLLQQHFSL